MKQIAFLITDYGVDGCAPKTILRAYLNEQDRDKSFDVDKNKAYYTKEETIVDLNQLRKQTIAKLNGLEKLFDSLHEVESKYGIKAK